MNTTNKLRDEAVEIYRNIKMLCAMASAAKPLEKGTSRAAMHHLDGIKGTIKDHRQTQRNRQYDPLQGKANYASREKALIERKISSVLSSKKDREFIKIGKHVFAYRNTERRTAVLLITVGYMWRRRVWENLYNTPKRFLNSDEYFILSAEEYRVNAAQVKLWLCEVYRFKDKKQMSAYIGQSKRGMQCVLRTTPTAAITAAQRLAAVEITKQVVGEPSHD